MNLNLVFSNSMNLNPKITKKLMDSTLLAIIHKLLRDYQKLVKMRFVERFKTNTGQIEIFVWSLALQRK